MPMIPKEIGRRANRIFMNVVPHYIADRDQQDQEDYGIDYELELMLPGDQASGIVFKVQVKGTTNLVVNVAGDTISYSELLTARMRYYLREISIPTALIVVDVTNEDVYWVRLQGNSEVEQAFAAAEGANQSKMTVHVPVAQRLPETITALIEDMARGQAAVLARNLRAISPNRVLEAARSLPDFDATVAAARAHFDMLRLERIERLLRQGDIDGAYLECERILQSESETAEARVAAGLNMIRVRPPRFRLRRTPAEHHGLATERVRTANAMQSITQDRSDDDELRLFSEFHVHAAALAAHTTNLVDIIAMPPRDLGVNESNKFAHTVHDFGKIQEITGVLAALEEASQRLARMLASKRFGLVPQCWGILVGDILVFVQMARLHGLREMATAVVTWVDGTFPQMVEIAEHLEDHRHLVLCLLVQIPLAEMGDVDEINRRAEIARSFIRKLPQVEQQRHMDAVNSHVQQLLQRPPSS